jgi:four helix bundle protein
MQDYRNLVVWQKAHALTLGVYADAARHLMQPLAWGLRDQATRAALSIGSNMAEGAGRDGDPEFRRFLFYSLGSTNELEYDLLVARDLSFITGDLHRQRTEQIEEVRRMLSSLIQRLTA